MMSIDIKIANNESTLRIIDTLIESGWGCGNEKHYLPVGDNDMYNWQSKKITDFEWRSVLYRKIDENEAIGVELFWKNREISISVLIFSPIEISITIARNPKYLNATCKILNVNWYLEKTVFVLQEKFTIYAYTYRWVK